jgi:hypothetical protein
MQTMLLAGILACQIVMILMLGAWEVRYQYLQYKMGEAQQQMRETLNKQLVEPR